MKRVAWITGAGGLIGSHIACAVPPEWTARALTRADFDLLDFAMVRETFLREKPQLIVHCAALSKTLECERNPKAARRQNLEVTCALAETAADIPLIFFSTDLVFDGRKGNYAESDAPNPLTVYAENKLSAERVVLANPRHTVVRTSLNAGRTRNGTAFNEQWRAAWQRDQLLSLFTDEFRSPIAAEVTARAIWELVAANKPGLYHLAGAEKMSRYDIGQALAAHESKARIERGSIYNFTGMRRSPNTSLDCAKIQRLLPFPLPKFSAWLQENSSALQA